MFRTAGVHEKVEQNFWLWSCFLITEKGQKIKPENLNQVSRKSLSSSESVQIESVSCLGLRRDRFERRFVEASRAAILQGCFDTEFTRSPDQPIDFTNNAVLSKSQFNRLFNINSNEGLTKPKCWIEQIGGHMEDKTEIQVFQQPTSKTLVIDVHSFKFM